MPRAVVFDTPGHLDLRAITCIGVNTKPNSTNPIGFFGTGLKYAVAVLCRMGIPLTLVTSGEVYAFYRKTERFRDKDFDFVRMKRQTLARTLQSRAQYSELSYTTEYGKTWELWQVFRELYSNTLDENGSTYVVEDLEGLQYEEGRTYIIVVSDDFAAEYDNRHTHFLPDGLRVKEENQRIQVLDRPSNHIYYRGMRVYDLDKPSAVTYNFLDGVELTEDRTAKNSFMLRYYVERYILTEAAPDITAKVVAAEAGSFESDLSYTNHSEKASPAFKEAVQSVSKVNVTARAHAQREQAGSLALTVMDEYPKPWYAEGNSIYDATDREILRGVAGQTYLHMSYMLRQMDSDLSGYDQRQWVQENAEALQEPEPDPAQDVVSPEFEEIQF